jgi:hypothetical protein
VPPQRFNPHNLATVFHHAMQTGGYVSLALLALRSEFGIDFFNK